MIETILAAVSCPGRSAKIAVITPIKQRKSPWPRSAMVRILRWVESTSLNSFTILPVASRQAIPRIMTPALPAMVAHWGGNGNPVMAGSF
jgi:hypothetical protein